MEQLEDSVLLQLDQLPPEILHHVATFLSPEDICNLRITSHFFLNVCDSEAIWCWFCKHQYGLSWSKTDSVSQRIYYQNFLYKYGKLIGLWQRQNVKYYSDLVCVSLDKGDKTIKIEHLMPKPDVFENVTRKLFLTISFNSPRSENEVIESTIEDALVGPTRARVKIYINDDDETELIVAVPNLTDYVASPAEWRKLLEDFQAWDTTSDTEMALLKFVSFYQSRDCHAYLPTNTQEWATKYHGHHQSNTPILKSIKPGVFTGNYSAHGIEMIHIMDGQGVKMTGDPNVPFNQVTFRVINPDIIDIPLENQETVEGLQSVLDDFESYCVPFDPNKEGRYGFKIPDGMHHEEKTKPKYSSCIGRWVAEAQVAWHNFQNPQFIKAYFILFSDDECAVMFLELNSIAFYHRSNV